jgi:hypothetical protein
VPSGVRAEDEFVDAGQRRRWAWVLAEIRSQFPGVKVGNLDARKHYTAHFTTSPLNARRCSTQPAENPARTPRFPAQTPRNPSKRA